MSDNPYDAFTNDGVDDVVIAPTSMPKNIFDQFDGEPPADAQPHPKAKPKSQETPPAELPQTPGVSFTDDPELAEAVERLSAAGRKEGADAANEARGKSFLDGLRGLVPVGSMQTGLDLAKKSGVGDPQQYAEFAKGVPPGAVKFFGTAATGTAGLQSAAAHNYQSFVQDKLDLLNKLDRGEPLTMAEMQADTFLYRNMSAEQRGRLKAEMQRVAAESVPTPLKERAAFQAGEAINKFAEGLFPAAPGYEQSVGRQLGEGLGSLVAGLPVGFVGRIPATVLYGTSGSGEAVERAVDFDRAERAAGRPGLSEDDINLAAVYGVAPGTTDLLPLEVLMGRLKIPAPWRPGFAKVLARIGGQALVEGVQEGGQQFLQNAIAKEIYNPEQSLTDEVVPNIGVGAGVGGIAAGAKELGEFALRRIAGRRGGHAKTPHTPAVDAIADQPAPEGVAPAPVTEAPQPATGEPAPTPQAEEAPRPLREDFETFMRLEEEFAAIPDDAAAPADIRDNLINAEQTLLEEFRERGLPGDTEEQARPVNSIDDVKAAFDEATPEEVADYWSRVDAPVAAAPEAEPAKPSPEALRQELGVLATERSPEADARRVEIQQQLSEGEAKAEAVAQSAKAEQASETTPAPATPEPLGLKGPISVFGVPTDGSKPFQMFIADMGEAAAHQNAARTAGLYEQKLAGYEFRTKDGEAHRFGLPGADSAPTPDASPAPEAPAAQSPSPTQRSAFRDLLRSNTPRKQWASELGASPEEMDALIKAAEAEGLLRVDRNGVVRRTKKAVGADGPMFALAGRRAQTANERTLSTAERMETSGRQPEQIYQATGWLRGPDGMWRFEIDDSRAKIINLAKLTEKPTQGFLSRMFGVKAPKVANARVVDNVPLPDIFSHPTLYTAYPFLRQMRVQLIYGKGLQKSGALRLREEGGRKIYRPIRVVASSEKDIRTVLLHELQHYIQMHEGFAQGSDVPAQDGGATLSSSGEFGKPPLYDPAQRNMRFVGRESVIDASLLETQAERLLRAYEQETSLDDDVAAEAREEIARLEPFIEQEMRVKPGAYEKSFGEYESRLVEDRADMTPEERRKSFPLANMPKNLEVSRTQTRDYQQAFDELMRRAAINKAIRERWAARQDIGAGVSVVRDGEDHAGYFFGEATPRSGDPLEQSPIYPDNMVVRSNFHPTITGATINTTEHFDALPYEQQRSIMSAVYRDIRSRNMRPSLDRWVDDESFKFWARYDPAQVVKDPRLYRGTLEAAVKAHYGEGAEVVLFGDRDPSTGEGYNGAYEPYEVYVLTEGGGGRDFVGQLRADIARQRQQSDDLDEGSASNYDDTLSGAYGLEIAIMETLLEKLQGAPDQDAALRKEISDIRQAMAGADDDAWSALRGELDVAQELLDAVIGTTEVSPVPQSVIAGIIPEIESDFSEEARGIDRDLWRAMQADEALRERGIRRDADGGMMFALRGFYSPAIRAAESLKQEKGTGDQFLAQITKAPGVKKDELDWMGLEEFLKPKKSVTRQEVLEFMRANQVRLDEKILGDYGPRVGNGEFSDIDPADLAFDDPVMIEQARQAWSYDLGGKRFYVVKFKQGLSPDTFFVYDGDMGFITEAVDRSQAEHLIHANASQRDTSSADVKFGGFKVPGGENYREMLIRLPELGEVVDPVGAKRLPEIQARLDVLVKTDPMSGRETVESENRQEVERLREEFNALSIDGGAQTPRYSSKHFNDQEIAHLRVDDRTSPSGEKVLFINEVQSDLHQAGRRAGYADENLHARADLARAELRRVRDEPDFRISTEREAELNRIIDEADAINDETFNNTKVPNAPFKGDLWLELALKRALQYATENGYDAISWSRSEQIAKAVGAEPEKLALQYDQKIGKFYDKYTKKWGGKVEPDGFSLAAEDNLDEELRRIASRAAGEKAPANPLLRITPEMHASVEAGQPLFAVSDQTVRDRYFLRLLAGEAVDVNPALTEQIRTIAEPMTQRLPKGVSVGVISRIEPIEGNPKEFLATFRRPDGSAFTGTIEERDIRAGRAAFDPRSNTIVSMRLGGTSGTNSVSDFVNMVRGEIHHEVSHALWGLLPSDLRAALVSHAGVLRILDMPFVQYMRLLGDPSPLAVDGDITVREMYEDAYSDRKNIADLLDDEAVAHMVELYSHGVLSPEQVAPVKAILDAIISDPAGLVKQAKAKGGAEKLLAQRPGDITETEAFKRWFGDSKVVDESGKPLRVYHGSPHADFSDDEAFIFETGESAARQARSSEEPSNAVYFTDSHNSAVDYAEGNRSGITEVYLKIERPLDLRSQVGESALIEALDPENRYGVIGANGRRWSHIDDWFDDEGNKTPPFRPIADVGNFWSLADEVSEGEQNVFINDIAAWALENGYDGLIFLDGDRGSVSTSYAAFDPTQIKSAIGNSGAFDPANPDIRLALGGKPDLPATIADISSELGIEAPPSGTTRAQIDAVADAGSAVFVSLYGERIAEQLAEYDAAIEAMAPEGSADPMNDGIAGLFREFLLHPDDLRSQARALYDDFADALDAEAPGLLEAIDAMHQAAPKEFPKGEWKAPSGVRAMRTPTAGLPDKQVRTAKAGTERPDQSLADLVGEFNKAMGLTVRQGRLAPGEKIKASQAGEDLRGQTSMETGVIRLKVPNEIETLAHEGGHALENRFKGDLDAVKQQFAKELEPLASPGPDALSEGFAEWFRRYVTNPPAAARTAPGFQNAFEEFLRARDPDLLASIAEIQKGYQAWIDAPSGGVVASDMTTTVPPGSMKAYVKEFKDEGLKKTFYNWMDRLYTAVFDDLNPMKKAVDGLLDIARMNFPEDVRNSVDVKATDNAYKLLRLARDGYSAGHMDLLYGVHDYRTIQPRGPSLRDAIATAFGGFDKSQWNEEISTDFGAYLMSRRMVQEWDRFKKGEISAPPDKFSQADHMQAIKDFEAKYEGFEAGANQVYIFQRNMLRKKLDAGLITGELFDELIKRKDYVPAMRDMSDRGGRVEGRTGGRKDKFSLISKFRGSQRAKINPLESIAKDTYETAMIIARNDALKALDALARAAGPDGGKFAERIPAHEMKKSQVNLADAIKSASKDAGIDAADMQIMLQAVDDQLGDNAIAQVWKGGEINEKGEPIVYLWEDGKRIPIRLADGQFGHDMLHAITGLSRESTGWFVNLMSLPSTAVRFGVTAALDFIGANYIRDQVSAWVLTKDFVPFWDGAKGIYSDLTMKDVSRIYSRVGGIMGGANVSAQHESRIKREVLQLRRKGIRFTLNPFTRDFWRMTEFSESGTRLAVFEKAFDRAKADGLNDWESAIEAAFIARDYIDFGRYGSKMLGARRLVPFLNAALQGLDRTMRGATGKVDADRPIRTLISPYIKSRTGQPLTLVEQGNVRQSAQLWGYVVALGMIGLAQSLLYRDDEEYEEISDYMKATHWLFRINGEWVRIPKPFEIATFSNLVERTFDYVYKGDATAPKRFLNGLLELTVPPHSIPGVDVTLQLAMNKSEGTLVGAVASALPGIESDAGRPIVGSELQGLPPEQQFNAYSSEFGKWLAKMVKISPAYIDHFITGFGASYGREFVNASDRVLPALGQATNGLFGLPTGTVADPALQDYFFLRRFTTDPTRGATSVRQFWQLMGQENGKFIEAAKGYKNLVEKIRDAKGAQEFLDSLPDEERAYALLQAGNSESRSKYRKLHPLNRAEEIVTVAGAVRREINLNRLYEGKDGKGEEVKLSPQQMRVVSDLLADITMREARNALIALKQPGWTQKKPLRTDTVYAELEATSPQVHKIFTDRLKSKKVPTYETVVQSWPVARERILEDGSAAIISDLYQRDYSPGVGAPLQ